MRVRLFNMFRDVPAPESNMSDVEFMNRYNGVYEPISKKPPEGADAVAFANNSLLEFAKSVMDNKAAEEEAFNKSRGYVNFDFTGGFKSGND